MAASAAVTLCRAKGGYGDTVIFNDALILRYFEKYGAKAQKKPEKVCNHKLLETCMLRSTVNEVCNTLRHLALKKTAFDTAKDRFRDCHKRHIEEARTAFSVLTERIIIPEKWQSERRQTHFRTQARR